MRADFGAQILWMWGETKETLGRLDRGQEAMLRRQDDMRREVLEHIRRVDTALLQQKKVARSMTWMKHLPWERVAFVGATILGAMGWIKPAWLAWLKVVLGM